MAFHNAAVAALLEMVVQQPVVEELVCIGYTQVVQKQVAVRKNVVVPDNVVVLDTLPALEHIGAVVETAESLVALVGIEGYSYLFTAHMNHCVFCILKSAPYTYQSHMQEVCHFLQQPLVERHCK